MKKVSREESNINYLKLLTYIFNKCYNKNSEKYYNSENVFTFIDDENPDKKMPLSNQFEISTNLSLGFFVKHGYVVVHPEDEAKINKVFTKVRIRWVSSKPDMDMVAEIKKLSNNKNAASKERCAAKKKRIENERIENERIENERIENERIENERIIKEKQESDFLEALNPKKPEFKLNSGQAKDFYDYVNNFSSILTWEGRIKAANIILKDVVVDLDGTNSIIKTESIK